MKHISIVLLVALLASCQAKSYPEAVSASGYLDNTKTELEKTWPKNRTINLVFHGHSVPSGYFKTPVVNTVGSYPYLLLKELKEIYPHAVINIITTAIGGEHSVDGAKRFESEVLTHRPDVIFIDYALNDRRVGLEKARTAWIKMIGKAVKKKCKVILLTPSPDQGVDILDATSELEKHSNQIRELARQYGVGIVDAYAQFKQQVLAGDSLSTFMSQCNHPNEIGHLLIVQELMGYFR